MKKKNLKKLMFLVINFIDKIIFKIMFQSTVSNTLNATVVAGNQQNQADMSH